MKNKVLITGSSGFIGTNIVEHFLNQKYLLKCIDCKEPMNKLHYPYWINVNILDYHSFRKSVLDFYPDYIIHLAARTDLNGGSLDDYSDNIKGVENLMKIVEELPRLKKVLVTSSMLVCHSGYSPKNQFDYAPTTIYGQSKVETEKIVWKTQIHCDWSILRPTSIWGPWFSVPYRNFFDMVISKKYFHIGNKGCTKTYGYVGNAIYQIEKILFTETYNDNNKVFYIGDNQPTNIEEWANDIAREVNYKIKRIPYQFMKCIAIFGDFLSMLKINFPMTSFRLHNMITDNIVNLENTCNIAPNPPYTREDGIKLTLKWLKEN